MVDDLFKQRENFSQGLSFEFFSSFYILLILKVENLTSFYKFRPISFCFVIYEVFSKILVIHLAEILPRLISQEQGTFLKSRSILNNISITQEMLQSLRKKVIGANIMIKLDMTIAYDRVDWHYLTDVLVAFGFSPTFLNLIWLCISIPYFSFLMNDTTRRFFRPSRGVHQRDPLSPYLFILGQNSCLS